MRIHDQVIHKAYLVAVSLKFINALNKAVAELQTIFNLILLKISMVYIIAVLPSKTPTCRGLGLAIISPCEDNAPGSDQ